MDGPNVFFSAPNEEIFKLICSLLQMRIDEINKLNRRFRDCNRFEITDIVLNQHCWAINQSVHGHWTHICDPLLGDSDVGDARM